MSLINLPGLLLTDGATKRHVALLHTGADMLDRLLPGITLDRCNLQGELQTAGAFEMIKKRLLLPESYNVIGVFYAWDKREWQILLESPELPETAEGSTIPQVQIWYTHEFTKTGDTVRLERIQIVGNVQANLNMLFGPGKLKEQGQGE